MKTKTINLNKIVKFVFLSLLTTFFLMGVAQAKTTKPADKIISQEVQEYKVLRNVLGENYVLLMNTKTGEYFDSSQKYKGCDFWKDKGDGTILKLNEMKKEASWGKFTELSGIDVDICVPFYSSRNQVM